MAKEEECLTTETLKFIKGKYSLTRTLYMHELYICIWVKILFWVRSFNIETKIIQWKCSNRGTIWMRTTQKSSGWYICWSQQFFNLGDTHTHVIYICVCVCECVSHTCISHTYTSVFHRTLCTNIRMLMSYTEKEKAIMHNNNVHTHLWYIIREHKHTYTHTPKK